jgi:hypothetical protein
MPDVSLEKGKQFPNLIFFHIFMQDVVIFNMLYFCKERSCLVKSHDLGILDFFEHARFLDQNATFDGHVEDVCDDAGNGQPQGTGTGSYKDADTSFDDPAQVTNWDCGQSCVEDVGPDAHCQQTEHNDPLHEIVSYLSAEGLDSRGLTFLFILSKFNMRHQFDQQAFLEDIFNHHQAVVNRMHSRS